MCIGKKDIYIVISFIFIAIYLLTLPFIVIYRYIAQIDLNKLYHKENERVIWIESLNETFLGKSYLYLPLKSTNAKTVEKFYKKISLTAGLPTDENKVVSLFAM